VYIQESWRILERGGHWYLTETPNRLCPYDGHTTQLWGVPWLPLKLARRYAIWRGRVESETSEEELVAMGIRGSTYFEIAAALRGHRFESVRPRGTDEVLSSVDLERPQSVGVFHLLEATVCRWAGIPIAALLPDLTICLKKLPDADQT